MKGARANLAPSGGMLDTAARTPRGFARKLRNCYFRVGSWVWRRGARKVHVNVYGDRLTWADTLKSSGPGTPTWDLLAATGGLSTLPAHFVRKIGETLVAIPYNGVTGPDYDATDSWRQWRAVQPSDGLGVFYACRRTYKGGQLYHVTKNAVTAAGIPAPASPTVASSGTVGTLAAGVYPVAYRYYTADGQYSPWSAPVNSGAIVVNEKRRWTIANSTHPRVVGKELAIGALAGDIRNVYGAATLVIADNTTTTFDEDVAFSAIDIEKSANFDLLVPPDNPEDVDVWDARLWLVSNDPSPLIWASEIDPSGASIWETFDPLFAFQVPSGSGERYMAFRAWDRTKAAVLTDSSARIVVPTASGYSVETLDEHHGCVSAAAVAIGGGILAWYDGHHLIASRGLPGDAQIVSRGWVDELLSHVPAAYAERATVHYVPDEGGMFCLCVPKDSGSTDPDREIRWKPGSPDEWHYRDYFAGTTAPSLIKLAASEQAGRMQLACFPTVNRIHRLDADVRQDEGPYPIPVDIETAAVEIPDGFAQVGVSRIHVGIRPRVDTDLAASGAAVTVSASLSVNDSDTSAVSATMAQGDEYIHVRTQNLADPGSDVTVKLSFSVADLLEVFDVQAETVNYQRESYRS